MERLKEEKEQEKKKPAAKAAAAAAPKKSEFGEALRHAGLRKTPETALQEAEAKPSTLWYSQAGTHQKLGCIFGLKELVLFWFFFVSMYVRMPVCKRWIVFYTYAYVCIIYVRMKTRERG